MSLGGEFPVSPEPMSVQPAPDPETLHAEAPLTDESANVTAEPQSAEHGTAGSTPSAEAPGSMKCREYFYRNEDAIGLSPDNPYL